MGFLGSGGCGSVLEMELMAIFHGLRVTWDKGFRRVLCSSDSLLAVSLIRNPPSSFHVHAVIIACIRAMLSRPWMVRLEHTLREGNACVDYMAKAGALQDHRFALVQEPPPDLVLLLLADARGISFIRR
ncbi:uncharacterized protein LOC130725286 [Lotus japonicus]|uniref:uncharacterized protein LOC130725286 n=1 Tax=Lotus japonicus TaxID=34305 RepID=UPI0025846585|nr:uncharacterized protein LOC130725286 [Lotus japonicus]